MNDAGKYFIDESREFLSNKYLLKIERCLEQLSDEDVWWRPNEESNSIGNLILHVKGNVSEWIVGGVGKLPFERVRQQEFDERQGIPRDELIKNLRITLKQANEILANLDAVVLTERRTIQERDVTVLQAIYHVVEHFSMHTGQIILLTKMRMGKDLKLYR